MAGRLDMAALNRGHGALMPYAQQMTHADRARRRAAIKERLRRGQTPKEIARAYGLTKRYVCQIAQDAGLSRIVGRPRGARLWHDCPAHLHADYDFLVRRKRIPVSEVRRMLEAAA